MSNRVTKSIKEKALQKAIKEVEKRRSQVIELIDKAALHAAQVTVLSMQFKGEDSLDLENQKIRMKGASEILDMAGYKTRKVEVTGKDGKDLFQPLQLSRGE